MDPTCEDEAEALNWVGEPDEPGVALKAAVGAWAGVMATPPGPEPTPIAASGVLEATEMGVTLLDLELATYAVCPSGVTAMPYGPDPTGIGAPAVLVATEIGVTVFESKLAT